MKSFDEISTNALSGGDFFGHNLKTESHLIKN